MAQPNVLLIVLDAVRADHLTPYGYDRPTTPNLDAFARRATRYDDAVAAAPWTPPSHAAMFTGRYPSNNGVYGLTPNLDPDQPHVAELLADRGYATGGFSNSYHTSPQRGFDRGFDYYHDILSLPRFRGTMYEPSLDFARHLYDYFVRDYDDSSFQLRRLCSWIDRIDRPFFGFINFNSAHSPYDPPTRFKSEFESYFDAWDAVDDSAAETLSDDAYAWMLDEVRAGDPEWDLVKCWYDGEIRYLDSLLGTLFDGLRDRGLFEDTMVVVTSDHGEQFGEDGLVYHQFSLAERLVNVPLLVKWPGQTSAETSDELVSLVDLAPSMVELATGEAPPEMDGRSLRTGAEPEAVFAEYAGPSESIQRRFAERDGPFDDYDTGLQAVRTARHKLVRRTDGTATLYDISDGTDRPIDDDELAADLRSRLEAALGELPRREEGEDLSEHVESHLEEMGYL
ncbi:sulfatase [Halosimplex carlsbadense 2-9-1]|uniref:Sulfatase n=1 Tax=Halosimplex carlsbadense 2-9-1 TaxID=797114 RepID=M0CP48_9EURY|nr:sulfatase [Halosimplex carlsbadense]ELZ24418.1 sulfatase [Halosimplex carlsbadense 2-9-1]